MNKALQKIYQKRIMYHKKLIGNQKKFQLIHQKTIR